MVDTEKIRVLAELKRDDIELVPKSSDDLMQTLSLVLGEAFLLDFWTTYRLPFGKVRICYPKKVNDPHAHWPTIAHELVHARQFAPWWGPLWMALLAALLPLPVLFSGRWFIERHAYLADIKAGRRTVDESVDVLWSAYAWCWPRRWMRRWFEARV